MELCTKPADHRKAEEAMGEIYRLIGLPAPSFRWLPNPLSVNFLSKYDSVKDRVQAALFPRPKPRKATYKSLVDCIGKTIENMTGSQEYLDFFLFGQHDSYLLPYSPHQSVFGSMRKNVNWFAPFRSVCMMVEKPLRQSVENNLTSHRSLPAIEYEGFKVYAIDGVVVPRDVVLNPGHQDVDDIRREKDETVRKVMIGVFAGHGTSKLDGYVKYLKERYYSIHLSQEDTRGENNKRMLWRFTQKDKNKKGSMVLDHTGHSTSLFVFDRDLSSFSEADELIRDNKFLLF